MEPGSNSEGAGRGVARHEVPHTATRRPGPAGGIRGPSGAARAGLLECRFIRRHGNPVIREIELPTEPTSWSVPGESTPGAGRAAGRGPRPSSINKRAGRAQSNQPAQPARQISISSEESSPPRRRAEGPKGSLSLSSPPAAALPGAGDGFIYSAGDEPRAKARPGCVPRLRPGMSAPRSPASAASTASLRAGCGAALSNPTARPAEPPYHSRLSRRVGTSAAKRRICVAIKFYALRLCALRAASARCESPRPPAWREMKGHCNTGSPRPPAAALFNERPRTTL